jgi:hypothetical protein
MRVMVLVKASEESEGGALPSTEELSEMGKFNEELVAAGVMLAAEGLHPPSQGKRVRFDGKKATVVDGPFTETKELVAGYWIWQVASLEEACEWLQRSPFQDTEVEVRRVFEDADFGENMTPDLKAAEQRLRTEVANQQR